MIRGGNIALLTVLAATVASCAGSSPDLGIRAITDPLAKATGNVGSMLGEAKGLLARGNIGLALEAYRKVLRAQPDNIEAFGGLAECYERMGRPELARVQYEAALAVAPKSPVLLNTFAASLERQGKHQDALALRSEAASIETAEVDLLVKGSMPATGVAAAATPSSSVTVRLPPSAPRRELSAPMPQEGRPRLERMSLTEVALVTAKPPQWRATIVRQTALSTTVRFVPLAQVSGAHGIRLLNAARHQGLAARTRLALQRNGWKSVAIGDARKVRDRSLVLYSPATSAAAQRLAAELGVGIAREPRPGPLTVLLGRDAVSRVATKG